MSLLPPLSSLPHTRAELVELVEESTLTAPMLYLLRWLIWFPLLSVKELTRLEGTRLHEQERAPSTQVIAARLQTLEQRHLITHLVANDPGWPPHEHRYALTDAGLYVFAARADPQLSVPRLAQAYPIERKDLLHRLARREPHLALMEFVTRLIAEGTALGYTLTSFQHPWRQTDEPFGRRQTLHCDAALLLADPQSSEHAFYIRVDTDEHLPFERRPEEVWMRQLFALRHLLHLHRDTMPHLLVLTVPSRLHRWGELLASASRKHGTALLTGAITTLDQLRHAGPFGSRWWPFAELTHWMHDEAPMELPPPSTTLSALLDTPASPILAERFSQRQTFAHLLTERRHDPLRVSAQPPRSYIGPPLTHAFATVDAEALAAALSGTPTEQREALALLNLTLSAMQKELLCWLGHQPLLTTHHLAALHHPGARTIEGVQRQMVDLLRLGLLVPFQWQATPHWRVRERSLLSESALRYLALREGRTPTFYVLPEQYRKEDRSPELNIQLGTAGLVAQMPHTHGLYQCMVQLLERAHRDALHLVAWKNARESVRTCINPLTDTTIQIRPDATLTLLAPGKTVPQSWLIEYDRATTSTRDLTLKYASYADYQVHAHRPLPPILVITQHARSAALIRECVKEVGGDVRVRVILEGEIPNMSVLTW